MGTLLTICHLALDHTAGMAMRFHPPRPGLNIGQLSPHAAVSSPFASHTNLETLEIEWRQDVRGMQEIRTCMVIQHISLDPASVCAPSYICMHQTLSAEGDPAA